MRYQDYYKTLGIERNASPEVIKRAYRRLARKYHPDVSDLPDAEERFKEVGEAYEVLRDPERRAAYDNLGSGFRAGDEFTPPPGFDAHGFSRTRNGFDFSDFFEAFFSAQQDRPGRRRRHPGDATRRSNGGATDETALIEVSLEDAFKGAERAITIRAGATTRTLRVKIPRGIVAGQKIRLAGQGGRGADLLLEVKFARHEVFRPDGRDIYVTLPITPWEAALGATVPVATLGGTVDLTIPPGARSASKLRLRGRGLGGRDAGDQYVVLQMVTPPANTPARREFYENMAREMPFNPRD